MAASLAINGFGRIGRVAVRVLAERGWPLELVALNDPFVSPEHAAHLTRYDSVYGRAPFEVEADGDALVIDGKRIAYLQEKDPAALPWERLGVELVIEATGVFRDPDKAEAHLKAGAERVLLSVPPGGSRKGEVPQILWRLNEETFDPSAHRIVSSSSCTTNSLAPVVKVLHETFGIEHGFLTTIHGYTGDQRLIDAPHKDLARARAAAVNIVPTSTGAARAIPEIFPDLKGKMDGCAFRVPVVCGSVSDFTAKLNRSASVDQVNSAFRKAAEGPLGEVMLVTDDPIVSTDILGQNRSAVVALAYTMALPQADDVIKVLSFYDNERGYVNRMLDVGQHIAR